MCNCRRCLAGLPHPKSTTSAHARVLTMITANEAKATEIEAARKDHERALRTLKAQAAVISTELDELRTAARVLNPRK